MVVALLNFDDLQRTSRTGTRLRIAVQSRVLAAVMNALSCSWPGGAERVLLEMEACGVGIVGTTAARVLTSLGCKTQEPISQTDYGRTITYLIPNNELGRVRHLADRLSKILIHQQQFEAFLTRAGYLFFQSHAVTDAASHLIQQRCVDIGVRDEELSSAALQADVFRCAQRGAIGPLYAETVTSWGAGALETLLRTREASLACFITCYRVGVLQTKWGSTVSELPCLQQGAKDCVTYLSFSYRGVLVRCDESDDRAQLLS